MIEGEDGAEIEVYTADEVQAKAAEAVAAKETEFGAVRTELEGKLTDAEKRAQERAGEFAQFRKLSEEDKAKLSTAERTIYENTEALARSEEARITAETAAAKNLVTTAIKAKAGTNATLEEEMTKAWELVGVVANTPEEIELKAQMVLGMLSVSKPDLVAAANGFSGGFQPPAPVRKEGDSFADTDSGKALGAELGLTLETPKK